MAAASFLVGRADARPLGLRDGFEVENLEVLDRLRAIEAFDWSPLDIDLAKNPHPPFLPEQIPIVKLDLLRFLSLRFLFEWVPPARPTPSLRLDDAWHEAVLHTRRYDAFCYALGGFAHHDPASEMRDGTREQVQAMLRKNFELTKQRYREAYAPLLGWIWGGRQRFAPPPGARHMSALLIVALRLRDALERSLERLHPEG